MIFKSVRFASAALLSCIVTLAKLSDVLQTYNWQEDIAEVYPKPWFMYTIKYISRRLKQIRKANVVQMLEGMKETLHKSYVTKHFEFEISHGSIGWEDLITALLFTKKVEIGKVPSDLSLGLVKESTKTWNFRIMHTSRLLIQFISLRVYGHYHLCSSDVLIEEHSQLLSVDRGHRLCGLQSGFILYTLHPYVKFGVRAKPTDVFFVFAFFDMISPEVLFNNLYLNYLPEENRNSWGTIFVFQASVHVTSIHVVVRKFCRVTMFLLSTRSHVELFDGPGALSPRVLPSSDSVTCSTFQCIILIKLETNQTEQINQTAYYRYIDTIISAQNVELVAVGSEVVEHDVKYHSSPQKQAPLHSLDVFHTSMGSYIKVVLNAEHFKGMEHPECLYGGVALVDSNEYKFEEIATFCWQNNNNFNFQKIIYSNRSTILLVSYMYYQYLSFLHVSFKMSATSCKVLKIDVCETVAKNRNQMILNDLLLSGKITIGEFYEGQMKGEADMKLTVDVCTIVQLFVKHNDYCSVPYSLHRYYHTMKMLVVKSGEKSLSDSLLHHQLSGVCSSMGLLGFSRVNPEQESHLKIAGTRFNFDNKSTSHFMALNTESQMVLNQSLSDWLVDEYSVTHVIRIQPKYNDGLYYNLAFSSVNLAHAGSLFFELAMWGAYSWIHVEVTPKKGHSQDILCVCHTPKVLPAIIQDSSLVLTVSEVLSDKEDLQLNIHVTLMVNRAEQIREAAEFVWVHCPHLRSVPSKLIQNVIETLIEAPVFILF